MDLLLSSRNTLLLVMGMSAYLGLLHIWYTRHWRDPHLWVGLWSAGAVASQLGRLVQLQTDDPLVAVAAARFYAGIAPFLIASLCGFARSLSGQATPRSRLAAFALGNLTLSLAILGSDWFLIPETSPALDWFGASYLGVSGRATMLVLPVYMAWACVFVLRELHRSELSRGERAALLGSLSLYATMGVSSVASSVGWIDQPGAAEYGPVVMGVGLSFLLVHRRHRLEDSLQSLVDARTAELAASESRYRGLIENAPIGIFACDPMGRITTRNPRLFEILGKPSAATRPEDNVLSHPLGIAAGVAETVRQCLSRGEVIHAEHRYTSSWGRTADVRLIVAPLRGTSGVITGALGLVEDISDQRTLEEGLRRSQKLESVGQLAAGIAHEINNPMAFVRTNLAVLREEWHVLKKGIADGEARDPALAERFGECEALIDESLEGIERTIAIARDMREFAHSGSSERGAVEINQLVESCVRFASPHCKGATRIDEQYGSVPPAWGNAGQLRQVFVNLLVNGLQAVGQVGTVRIATAHEGDRVVVRVSDDGAGVKPEHLDRLFDPFFTTKPAGEGTGLGLYVSHEIVRGHGGEITVSSTPGQGASFAVRLPLADTESDAF